ncbi:L,D-transpeptidase [Kovacikia minuta CCNUW1]|uniref:L,D-transpeptidase n=1 Tax=Kovacikia minuta TaxID=2931930 RepID=UPI001CCCBE85|nr:L,D-transpeptidase [Kovacikia minuta]UBF26106.1 L,D-transpeptidase [Kovacikia minuta CCNUW1]
MPATVRDESIPRSIMFLCLGTAAVLLVIQWRVWASSVDSAQTRTAKPVATQKVATVQAASQDSPPAPGKQSSPVQEKLPLPTSDGSETANQGEVSEVSTVSVQDSSKLIVDLSDRRVYLYQGKQRLVSYPLAVGKDGWETPTGNFKVIEMQKNPEWLHPITKEVIAAGPDNPLGKRWIGFLIEGQTHIGFHGTNEERLIGQAVSHGCLRMRNRDVIALYEKIKMGTLVTVRQ